MTPTPQTIRTTRTAAGLTQSEAAQLVYLTRRQTWLEYEAGRRPMPEATWELFQLKTRSTTLRERWNFEKNRSIAIVTPMLNVVCLSDC